ncbi:hypothetical protein TVAG_399630 [Trichomonas vaginalis G3]|uniref:Uncharacterized protein n=1 Tax=Trichomonas vaginalis (strain ATCC PRA-98 / G3) TaxID=412133 RepID=A2E600_TRIV3|nr:hypothetical protein TVAGG3_0337430 [Trichomonas vaginalis G3]EAY11957.1 hypothetical protein TVAG_399630 [Trichomonas vaginalis G3]KAI5530378.1 hypothetical protein TVAGG3_0337430 [Trichomonas vaginalis G3]|eukprot:XP_001324180.1 hypothetical protein [Trichomonas vaginalis G3]
MEEKEEFPIPPPIAYFIQDGVFICLVYVALYTFFTYYGHYFSFLKRFTQEKQKKSDLLVKGDPSSDDYEEEIEVPIITDNIEPEIQF